MVSVRLYDGEECMASVPLDAVPREGELLSFSATPAPQYWSAETEANHRRLEGSLWKVSRVIHFLHRPYSPECTQFVSVYLVPHTGEL